MEKKQNMTTWKELNGIELERASYLINSVTVTLHVGAIMAIV